MHRHAYRSAYLKTLACMASGSHLQGKFEKRLRKESILPVSEGDFDSFKPKPHLRSMKQ